uniref:Uncharacterized protein n=1 Tax=Arundo donax TaxID=35708 RepID=A0A0A9HQD8_ARUDO
MNSTESQSFRIAVLAISSTLMKAI